MNTIIIIFSKSISELQCKMTFPQMKCFWSYSTAIVWQYNKWMLLITFNCRL